ncbi:MAG: polysaccharide deacetylase family protein [Oscillospiraceae bacterium]|nr:polysaccharide deacetylase family protein [Oscillospiraceae bacterium]
MKRLWPIASVFLLFLVIVSLPAKADSLYFAVVDQRVSPFDLLHQPWASSNHGIMMPHIVLTGEISGPNGLGLQSQWSPEENYFTLYNNREYLTFVFRQNTAFSSSKRFTAPLRQVVEGDSMVFFVPIELVCEVFGFTVSTYSTQWGTMVRIRSGNNTLSDELFVRSREFLIVERYEEYQNSLPSPTPSPNVSLPPTPFPSGPSPSPPELFPVSVYLTFDGASNSATGRLLDFLEEEGLPALFFLPPESLADDPVSARRIAARHQIGLLLDEPDGEALSDAIRRGNTLLREAAFVKTWLLRSDNAPSESSDYRYWGHSHRFTEEDDAQEIVSVMIPLLQKTLEPTAALVLSLPQSDAVTDALAELLPLIDKENIWSVNPGELPVR